MKTKIKLKINNKDWIIKLVDAKYLPESYGECDDAYDVSNNTPQIWIRNDLSKKDTLDTLVHEVLHASRPELCEEAVDYTASLICKAIEKMEIL
jgi:hypothetical protein